MCERCPTWGRPPHSIGSSQEAGFLTPPEWDASARGIATLKRPVADSVPDRAESRPDAPPSTSTHVPDARARRSPPRLHRPADAVSGDDLRRHHAGRPLPRDALMGGQWFSPSGDRRWRVRACPDHLDGLTGLREFGRRRETVVAIRSPFVVCFEPLRSELRLERDPDPDGQLAEPIETGRKPSGTLGNRASSGCRAS